MSIQDRVVILTGATGNLGRVAARQLAEAGARLVLVGTDLERLRRLPDELGLPTSRALCHSANLRDPAAARGLVQAATQAFGRVDVGLHLVGGWTGGKTVVEAAASELDEMLQQHVWTTWHLAQAVVPALTANGWGRLIVVSSPLAVRPAEKGAPYAMAKAAEEVLLLTLAQELRNTKVTANVLQVRTIDAQHERDAQRTAKNATWTTPEEIAAAILYLCSDAAQTVNGARLPLFGPA